MLFQQLIDGLERMDAVLGGYLHGSLWVSAVVVLLLGLRHATDPDHIVAVTELIAQGERGRARAARLGAAWGAGHAMALLAVGTPMIWLKWAMPGAVVVWSERLVGVVIIALAVRLFVRWLAAGRWTTAASPPPRRPVRTPLEALAVGSLHGFAGAAAVVLLLAAAAQTAWQAMLFLALFAPMTALSMVFCSVGVSWTMQRSSAAVRALSVPALCLFSLLFGVWYVANSLA